MIMRKSYFHVGLAALLVAGLIAFVSRQTVAASDSVTSIPKPAVDQQLAGKPGQQQAVFAGGCFWGVQAVFQHVKGVVSATSGYSGGGKSTADYETVSTGTTDHAESVQVVYDPSKITYG